MLAAAAATTRRAVERLSLRDDIDRLAGELIVPVAFAGGVVLGLLLSRVHA